LQATEKVPVKAPITGKKTIALKESMSAYGEIRHHTESLSTGGPILFPCHSSLNCRILIKR